MFIYIWDLFVFRTQCNIKYLLIIRLYNNCNSNSNSVLKQSDLPYSPSYTICSISSLAPAPAPAFAVVLLVSVSLRLSHSLETSAILNHSHSPQWNKCAFVFNFITKHTLIIAINNPIKAFGQLALQFQARTPILRFERFERSPVRCCSFLLNFQCRYVFSIYGNGMAYATQPVGMCLIRRNENCTERAFLLPQIEGISNRDICREKKKQQQKNSKNNNNNSSYGTSNHKTEKQIA